MEVGELVDAPVEHDALHERGRKAGRERSRGAPHKVAQKGPHAGGIGRSGEMKMGEEVQDLR